MKSSNYTMWGIFFRVVLVLWPIYLIQSAWYEGSLIKLIAAIVVLLLIIWWAVSYIIKFYKHGKELAAQREAALAKAREDQAQIIAEKEAALAEAKEELSRLEAQRAELQAQREAAHANEREGQARAEAQHAEKREQQENWEKTHGRLVTRIAGVTFENDDGSSRQKYLKEAYANEGVGTLGLESYDYQGEPAIRVLYDDMCIGNIPKDKVQDFMDVIDRITAAYLDVERFCPDDDDARRREVIYRADLTIVYSKV